MMMFNTQVSTVDFLIGDTGVPVVLLATVDGEVGPEHVTSRFPPFRMG